MAVYTDAERAYFRLVMGYSKLFSSSNAVFENALDVIQATTDDGSTFNLTISLMNQLKAIDTQRATNSNLGLATEVVAEVKYDAARNDLLLKSIGRSYIKQLSIIVSMKPHQDYYRMCSLGDGNTDSPNSYDFSR